MAVLRRSPQGTLHHWRRMLCSCWWCLQARNLKNLHDPNRKDDEVSTMAWCRGLLLHCLSPSLAGCGTATTLIVASWLDCLLQNPAGDTNNPFMRFRSRPRILWQLTDQGKVKPPVAPASTLATMVPMPCCPSQRKRRKRQRRQARRVKQQQQAVAVAAEGSPAEVPQQRQR